MLDIVPKIILHAGLIINFLAFVAGQIFLVGRIVARLGSKNELLNVLVKFIGGIGGIMIVNAPAYLLAYFYAPSIDGFQEHKPPIFLSLLGVVWGLSIMVFGYYNLIRDYWTAYKKAWKK